MLKLSSTSFNRTTRTLISKNACPGSLPINPAHLDGVRKVAVHTILRGLGGGEAGVEGRRAAVAAEWARWVSGPWIRAGLARGCAVTWSLRYVLKM